MLIFSSKMPGTFIGSKIEYFILGVLAGIFRNRLPASPLENNALMIQLIIGGTFLYFIIELIDHKQTASEFWSHQYYAILSGVIVYIFSFQTKITAIFLNNKPMQKLGLWSFSLYLTHSITIHYFSKTFTIDSIYKEIIAIIISILASYIFYKMIEFPGINIIKALLLSFANKTPRSKSISKNDN
jgi:peptidoglycan/LPS O-acetylase OafA/YrhL